MVVHQRIKRIISTLIVAALITATFSCVSFGAAKTVKVAWYNYGGYQLIGDEGQYDGLTYTYLNSLSKYIGIDFEFVKIPWEKRFQKLKSGAVDIVPTVIRTPQIDKKYSTSNEYARTVLSFFVKKTSDAAYEDYDAMDGMVVGATKGDGGNISALKEVAKKNNFRVKFKNYSSLNEIKKAVRSGKVDAGIHWAFTNDPDLKSIMEFNPKHACLVASKGNKALINSINRGMNFQLAVDPTYDADLYNKYIGISRSSTELRAKEKKYISNMQTPLTIGYVELPGLFEKKEKEVQGIGADIINRLGDITGIKIVFKEIQESDYDADKLHSLKIDGVALCSEDYYVAGEQGLNLTSTYLEAPLSMAVKKGADNKAINVLGTTATFNEQRHSREIDYKTRIEFDSVEEGIRALDKGTVDGFVENSYSLAAYLRDSGYENIHSVSLGSSTFRYCMGFDRDLNDILFRLIDREISGTPDSEILSIVTDNTEQNAAGLKQIIQNAPWYVILALLTLVLTIAVSLGVLLRRTRKAKKRIEEIMYTDDLTGLSNSRGFSEFAKRVFATNKNDNLLIIDFDVNGFKEYNQINGHEAGNNVLKNIATQIKKAYDIPVAARTDNDHFMYIAKFVSIESYLERLNKEYETFREIEGMSEVTLRFGIYQVKDRNEDISVMRDKAIAAKNMIKRSEKLCAVYDHNLYMQKVEDVKLLADFGAALANGEIRPFYQPKIYLKDGSIFSAEALARWVRPSGEIIEPERFVNLLETSGRVTELDMHILRCVCSDLRKWREAGGRPVRVSVNFARKNLYRPDFVESVVDVLGDYEVSPEDIIVEITEEAFSVSEEVFRDTINNFEKVGIKISIDDFGMGFSSLSVIQRFRVEAIKLDKSLVDDLGISKRAKAIVRAVIMLARELDIHIVAEGIETYEQERILKELGCDVAQGYLYAKPLPRGEFFSLIKSRKKY